MAQWDEQNSTASTNSQKPGNGHAGALAGEDAQAQMQQAFDNARAEVDRYVSTAADFIRERPVMCVAGAIAIGFLVGKIASRK
jgi:ElaB/YqjD/DUF883 family membrane-anchored ribosome-binding protein